MKEKVIDIDNLKKSFGPKKVLDGVSLTVQEGKNVVILGRSGTGKSVFAKCIVGLIQPDEGNIEVLGYPVLEMDEEKLDNTLRKSVAFVFQGAALYDSITVGENLAFPLRRSKIKKPEMEKRVKEALDNVGLGDALNKMPSELSGGMRKRIGVARALIINPKIILYDEPTTGLDAITSREISDLIVDVQKQYKTSSIIITHDMACARATANRMVVLHEGKFIAEGSYDELEHSDNKLVNAFFN